MKTRVDYNAKARVAADSMQFLGKHRIMTTVQSLLIAIVEKTGGSCLSNSTSMLWARYRS